MGFLGIDWDQMFSPGYQPPPPQPDYAGQAQAQGSENRETAYYNTRLNNPNIIGPYGNQTTTYQTATDPRTGQLITTPTMRQVFSPQQQAIFDQGNAVKLGLMGLANQGTSALGDVIGKNVDLSGVSAVPRSGEVNQRVIDAMQSRTLEDYGRKRDEAHSQMIAAGLRPGAKGYDDAMQLIQRGENDAKQQAVLAGYDQGAKTFGQDTQSRAMELSDYYAKRQTPLNEVGYMSGLGQVQNPYTMSAYSSSSNAQAAPLFAATQAKAGWDTDMFNAQNAMKSNQQQGMMGLAGTALMGASMMF